MATTHECFKCYRRRERADRTLVDEAHVDRHTSAITTQQWRVMTAHTQLFAVFKKLRVDQAVCDQVLELLQPWFLPAARWLDRPSAPPVKRRPDAEWEDE